jgi:hypothetical protein
MPTKTDCFVFTVENLTSPTPYNFTVDCNDWGLIAFEFGTKSVSEMNGTLPPLTTSGGFCKESISELVVGSTYAPKVPGMAVVLTSSVLYLTSAEKVEVKLFPPTIVLKEDTGKMELTEFQ